MIRVTDFFCGGGGSSTGMIQIPDVEIVIAANHWDLAVEVHNENHPDTDHATADLHLEDPRYFPYTEVCWGSPECTKWSQGNSNQKPAIEEGLFEDPLSNDAAHRSRLLMFDMLRYAEHHRYPVMIVENVVDIATQPKYRLAWHVWRQQLSALGYRFRVISLNSMHAQAYGPPAPQSRDRIYIGCWLEGVPAPDFERVLRPSAWCPKCEQVVESQQAWKNGRTVGRYRQQYVYVHGLCGTVVEPGWLPASSAIDWSLPGRRIGDRAKPLAPKTVERIAAGIARYWQPFTLEAAGNTFERRPGVRTWPIDEPLRTLHTTASKALAVPVEGRDGKQAKPMSDPMRTLTCRAETAMVTPFIAELRGGGSTARPVDHPLATVTASGNHHALIAPYYGRSQTAKPVSDPLGTISTHDHHALIMTNNHANRCREVAEALPTLTTANVHALIMRNNTARGDQGQMLTPAFEVLRTLTTAGHQSLVTPGDVEAARAQVDDCLFRMLEPSEVAAGMAFPSDYRWRGNRRERVRMAGNAVTPPAARDLIACVAEALGSAA